MSAIMKIMNLKAGLRCVAQHIRQAGSVDCSLYIAGYRMHQSLPSPPQPLLNARFYGKKASKMKKDKGGKNKASQVRSTLTDEELNSVIHYDKMCDHMQSAVGSLQAAFASQLSVRSNAGVLDAVQVETPDGKFPLIQLAQITKKNPHLVVVNLTSTPQYIKHVKMAISESGMNLNPQQDGTTLFVPIPKVTREHREELAKNAKNLFTKTKDKLRDIHNVATRDLKKKKSAHSEDLIYNTQSHVDLKMKEYVDEAELLMATKQKELLQD